MQVEEVNISTLKHHPRNVRVHPEENIRAIMVSLKEFGQQKPIVVDIHGQVIAGNGTLESARRLGWKRIQIVRTKLDGHQAEAFAITDNKTTDMSTFDFELLSSVMKDLDGHGVNLDLTGFQAFEREPLLEAEWNAPEAAALPEAGAAAHTVKFTEEQWELVQAAIKSIKESGSEFDTESDGAALSVVAHSYMESHS